MAGSNGRLHPRTAIRLDYFVTVRLPLTPRLSWPGSEQNKT